MVDDNRENDPALERYGIPSSMGKEKPWEPTEADEDALDALEFDVFGGLLRSRHQTGISAEKILSGHQSRPQSPEPGVEIDANPAALSSPPGPPPVPDLGAPTPVSAPMSDGPVTGTLHLPLEHPFGPAPEAPRESESPPTPEPPSAPVATQESPPPEPLESGPYTGQPYTGPPPQGIHASFEPRVRPAPEVREEAGLGIELEPLHPQPSRNPASPPSVDGNASSEPAPRSNSPFSQTPPDDVFPAGAANGSINDTLGPKLEQTNELLAALITLLNRLLADGGAQAGRVVGRER